MPGCAASASPARAPNPGSTLITPGGRSSAATSEAKASADTGVSSAGLTMIVLPAAIAGHSFQASMTSGEFQGMMAPTTPTGSLRVYVKKGPVGGMVAPDTVWHTPAKYSK